MTLSTTNRGGISLRRLLPDAEFIAASDIRVASCASNSKQIQPGDLFVALPGVERDGHEFARAALHAGASAFLTERFVPVDGRPVCIVPDTRPAYAKLCHALVGNPASAMTNIGITGTNGKTSTTMLVSKILSLAGREVGSIGTLGIQNPRGIKPSKHTTPPALLLAHAMSEMESLGCSHCVMEVSSHALSQHRVTAIPFQVACVTNVRRDHLDYHGSIGNYQRTKGRLVEHLDPDGTLVLNADDPIAMGFAARHGGDVATFSATSPADVTANVLERSNSDQTFLLSAGSDMAAVHCSIVGGHHLENCLAAAAIAWSLGVPLATIARGIEAVTRIPGRMDRVECGQPFNVFVDFAHTPDALAATLDALRPVTEGRVICVFGAGGDRDPRKRPLMGSAVERRSDLAIVTADNPRSESPEDIATDILQGFNRRSAAVRIDDRADAIRFAIESAQAGDTVVIAGKGHEKDQVIGKRSLPFCDREVANEVLYQLQVGLTA